MQALNGPQRPQSGAHCHKHIRKVARALAAESFEMVMSDNRVYKAWKLSNPDCVRGPSVDRKALQLRFVERKWALYISAARATLVGLLQQPIDENLKEEIMEILALDGTLKKGRLNPATIAGTVQQKR